MSSSNQPSLHTYRYQANVKIADRYQVIKPLGFGGFAEVYLCQDNNLPRKVAVKVITHTTAKFEEAHAAARLNHPNIVTVHDVQFIQDKVASEKVPIIVFEYVESITLETRLNKARYRRLELNEETVKIIRDVAQALDYAHSQNVIHRDVKPSNIILETNEDGPKAYLTDFGLAQVKEQAEGESMISVELRQRLSGTLPYMAPEQLHDENQRGATTYSDQYSLGVTVYEMLTGRLPYQGRDANLIIQIATTEPMPPTVANQDLPEGLAPVLLKALDKDPENRYRNCREFVNEIEQAAQAYINAAQKYETALAHLAAEKWREAFSLLHSIQSKTPGYKETAYQLEQAQKKVRSLDLFEKAKLLVAQAAYQEALDKLNLLSEIDPEFEVTALRREAVQKQAAQRHENLDQMYQQAVSKFKEERYRDVLAAMALIREEKPDYEDRENIEEASQAIVDRQQKLRELYNQGKLLAQQEEWDQALETFKALKAEEAEYEDLENQLTVVRLLGRLSTLLREATERFEGGSYTATIDRLDKLVGIESNYKAEQVAALRQQAVNQLYLQSDRYYTAGRYEESLDLLKALQQRQPGFEGITDLEEKNREGVRQRDLRKRLDQYYDEAKTALNEKNFEGALLKWQEIQAQKADLSYEDKEAVAERATAGLYTAGLGLLSRQPKQALEQLERIRRFEPDFVDSEQLEPQANEAIEKRKLLIRVGVGAGIVVVLLLVGAWLIWGNGGIGGESEVAMTMTAEAMLVPTDTVTPTSTTTTTSTFTPTSTHVPTSTMTPTEAPTATITFTPTHTPTPTATPANIATALLSSSIFTQPDENSVEKTFVNQGESVIVLEQQNSWIRVINDEGIEGWASANRFEITIGVPTETPIPTNTPTPTNTPGAETATAHSSATIYGGPGTNYAQITFINAGTVVTVLGRFSNNSWLFVRTLNEIEGWVAASLMNYPGNISQLPIVNEIITVTPTSGGGGGGGGGTGTQLQGLTFDFWPLPGQFSCTATGWTQMLFMEGHGGDGRYSYYINDQRVAGPLTTSFTYQLSGGGTATVHVSGRVTSGDGQSQEFILFVDAPDCN
ncbi:MAG: protein kinase [Anaerolineae bacterium]|nr:protein kinase [Anaerolineae bacterium]